MKLRELIVEYRKTNTDLSPNVIRCAEDIAKYGKSLIEKSPQEKFIALYLNTRNRVLSYRTIGVGDIDACNAAPRTIFSGALLINASRIIVMHNHPSGDPTPSVDDIAITNGLRKGGELLDIPILDHVIIGDGEYYSFKTNNKL